MGQIEFNGQKPKYANKLAITTGTKADIVLNENEIWLIDSTNANKYLGRGKYDKYIKGDGQTAAKNLPLLDIDPDVPTHLSQLTSDTDHRTVSDEQISRWNEAAAGEGGTLIESSADINIVNDAQQSINRLEFANKAYNTSVFSGFGKKYLKKNISTDKTRSVESIDVTLVDKKYINLSPTIGSTISESEVSANSMAYFKVDVSNGGKYIISAKISDKITSSSVWATRMWSLTDENGVVLDCYKSNNEGYLNEMRVESAIIDIKDEYTINGNTYTPKYLWVNTIIYLGKIYKVKKVIESQNTISINKFPISELSDSNTIYIIQYDYDCNYQTITVPDNSTLLFVGGSMHNAFINGNNTSIINVSSNNIFGENTELYGYWETIDFYPEWFGAASDGVTDDTDILQKILDFGIYTKSNVVLNLSNNIYKTTRGLYFHSNTTITGGTIIAEFSNLLDWVLQTYTIYTNGNGESALIGYQHLASWQEHDAGRVSQTNGSSIKNLTIKGALKKNEEDPENIFYQPIYGGIKIQASQSIYLDNVRIEGVGIGLARGTCLQTYDNHLNIDAYFTGFASYALNGHSIRDSYLNAHCHTEKYNENDNAKVIPYGTEYQNFAVSAGSYMKTYFDGNGGINTLDPTLTRPLSCSVKLVYAEGLILDNVLVDAANELDTSIPCEVGIVATYSGVVIRKPWWEGINKCFIYARLSRISIECPTTSNSVPEYDVVASSSNVTFIECKGKIECSGKTTGTTHKYSIDSNEPASLFYCCSKSSAFPDDDNFYFLSKGDDTGLGIVNASGTTLNAIAGKYYKYSTAVETLSVILPAMDIVSSVKPIVIDVTNKTTVEFITFTSADNKPISYYDNYTFSNMNTEYEISCIYNGSKWIIAAAVIE